MPGHNVAWREAVWCDAIVGGDGIKPEDGVFHKMDEHDVRDVAKGLSLMVRM